MKTAERMRLLTAEAHCFIEDNVEGHAKTYVKHLLKLIEGTAKEGLYEFDMSYSSSEPIENVVFWNTVKSILENEHGFQVEFFDNVSIIRISWYPA